MLKWNRDRVRVWQRLRRVLDRQRLRARAVPLGRARWTDRPSRAAAQGMLDEGGPLRAGD